MNKIKDRFCGPTTPPPKKTPEKRQFGRGWNGCNEVSNLNMSLSL